MSVCVCVVRVCLCVGMCVLCVRVVVRVYVFLGVRASIEQFTTALCISHCTFEIMWNLISAVHSGLVT